MDAFSETLRAVRLAGAFFVQARFTAPWCYFSPHARALAPILEPGAERVVIFHFITRGDCFVERAGQPPLRLVTGDAVLFPHGDEHLMTSRPGLVPEAGGDVGGMLRQRPVQIDLGGGGAPTEFLCGYMACSARLAGLLLDSLPPVVRVNLRDSEAGAWLEPALRQAGDEARSSRPGAHGLLSKLAEVLFIELLRLHVQSTLPQGSGWLAGLGDRVVGAALNALHAEPARDWTLESLARHVGTSRSVLAERFQQLVGTTTMQYLTQWRMMLAADLLLTRAEEPLVRIAEEVGYETDTSFSRAFRREYGMPPSAWRRSRMPMAA